jgi:hypothetical protein
MALANPTQPEGADAYRLAVKIAIEPDGGADFCGRTEAPNDLGKVRSQ